jgi:hypothetical protein
MASEIPTSGGTASQLVNVLKSLSHFAPGCAALLFFPSLRPDSFKLAGRQKGILFAAEFVPTERKSKNAELMARAAKVRAGLSHFVRQTPSIDCERLKSHSYSGTFLTQSDRQIVDRFSAVIARDMCSSAEGFPKFRRFGADFRFVWVLTKRLGTEFAK